VVFWTILVVLVTELFWYGFAPLSTFSPCPPCLTLADL